MVADGPTLFTPQAQRSSGLRACDSMASEAMSLMSLQSPIDTPLQSPNASLFGASQLSSGGRIRNRRPSVGSVVRRRRRQARRKQAVTLDDVFDVKNHQMVGAFQVGLQYCRAIASMGVGAMYSFTHAVACASLIQCCSSCVRNRTSDYTVVFVD